MFGLTKAKLKDFTILIEAPISIKNVKIKNKNRFAFWKKDYEIRLYYKVGSLTVDTQANCQCSKIIDPPPEPEDDVTPPEDEVVDPPEEPEDEIEKSCSEGEYETDSVCR